MINQSAPHVVSTVLAGARSPLRYVILVLGLGLVVSCGIFGLVRSSPSALGLDTRGPDAVGGDEGALAREGGSWKMPKKQLTGRCDQGKARLLKMSVNTMSLIHIYDGPNPIHSRAHARPHTLAHTLAHAAGAQGEPGPGRVLGPTGGDEGPGRDREGRAAHPEAFPSGAFVWRRWLIRLGAWCLWTQEYSHLHFHLPSIAGAHFLQLLLSDARPALLRPRGAAGRPGRVPLRG